MKYATVFLLISAFFKSFGNVNKIIENLGKKGAKLTNKIALFMIFSAA